MIKTTLLITASLSFSAIGLQAASVLYDFNQNGEGSSTNSSISGQEVGFHNGSSVASNAAQNGTIAHSSTAAAGENMFFISARSSGNHTPTDGIPSPGTESYLSFTLNSSESGQLDFSNATFSFDATAYNDTNNSSFTLSYQLYADTGNGFVSIGDILTLNGDTAAASDSQTLTNTDGSALNGWSLADGTVRTNTESFVDIDLSALGLISGDEITFAIAFSGTRNNHSDYASSIDNVNISGINVIPEPTSSALLGLGGIALLLRKRR